MAEHVASLDPVTPSPVSRMSSTSAVLVAFSVSLSLSLSLFIYQRALTPIYGFVPTHLFFKEIVLAAIVLATTLKWFWRIKLAPWLMGAGIFLILPKCIYWVPVWTARWGDPVVGPTVTHLLTLLPLVLTYTLAGLTYASGAVDIVASAGVIYLSTWTSKTTWERYAYLNGVSETRFFLTLSALWLFIYIYHLPSVSSAANHDKKSSKGKKTNVSPSRNPQHATPKFILVVTYLIGLYVTYPVLKSPVLPHPLESTYTHPTYPVQIHSSVQSTTGLIVVGQALPSKDPSPDSQIASVRYLRAAHSILGGVWTDERVHVIDDVPPLVDSHGTKLGDSIYGAFILQEAARMVNNTGKSHPEDALVIGLGAGISTTSLMRHGIKTSIIEIDPAVYDAARTWFGLPDPTALGGQVYLEDAREWMKKAASRNDTVLYDIIIHDCFSGGGVPEQLYTVEFWNDLKTVLRPQGVLVVNFVGQVDSPSSRMVLYTLEKTIGRCRAFHDDLKKPLAAEKYKTEFLNILFFCSTSPQPPTFRDSRRSDWLGSPLRRHALSELHQREIDLDLIRGADADGYLLTDASNSLNKLQEEQGGFHWKLMREVLPDMFWEVY